MEDIADEVEVGSSEPQTISANGEELSSVAAEAAEAKPVRREPIDVIYCPKCTWPVEYW